MLSIQLDSRPAAKLPSNAFYLVGKRASVANAGEPHRLGVTPLYVRERNVLEGIAGFARRIPQEEPPSRAVLSFRHRARRRIDANSLLGRAFALSHRRGYGRFQVSSGRSEPAR
jgi:hypothetical protein